MQIYYKALTGFGGERVVSFTSDELEKVTYAFLREKRVLLKDGQSVDGKYIQQISPDFHRTMGWAQEYRLGPDDYNELSDKGIDRAARDIQAGINQRVQYLLASKQEHLIGSGVELPKLNTERTKPETNGMKRIAQIA